MDQARRDRYLTALGVVRYRPRPPARAVAAPVDEPVGSAIEVPAVPEGPAALLAQLQPSDPPCPAPLPVAPGSIAPGAPVGDAEQLLPPLRLACWRPAPDLLVLDAQPPGGLPNRDQLTLLGNILTAIGRRPGTLSAAEFIDWPLLPGGDCSLAGAREALALFLHGRQSQSSFAWLLVLGEPAWQFFADAARAGQLLAVAGGAVQAILAPGLAEMLANPACKAQTWQAIRFLVAERE